MPDSSKVRESSGGGGLAPSYVYKAMVAGVTDGDTVVLTILLGFHAAVFCMKFRIARINAAEKTSPDPVQRESARKATEFVSSKIMGKEVVICSTKALKEIGTEKYGRYLVEIYYMDGEEQKNLSDELLKAGLVAPWDGKGERPSV